MKYRSLLIVGTLLLDVTNPGDWMIHCHIAEHLTNGMMGLFTVE